MISVVRVENPIPGDKRPYFKLRILLPEQHLETPDLASQEYAYNLIDMMMKDSKCKHCGEEP